MKTIEIVQQLLIKYPKLKDCDNNLISTYWFNELKEQGINPKDLTAFELLDLHSKSKLTNTKSIIRFRRKLQEEHPELRGKKYKVRKGILQDEFKQELGYEKNN